MHPRIYQTPSQVLEAAEREKIHKYSGACQLKHASFSPICATVDGLISRKTNTLMKRLANKLVSKWEKQYTH